MMRQLKLDDNIERVHNNNEKIYQKQAFKSQRVKENEYNRLNEMITH